MTRDNTTYSNGAEKLSGQTTAESASHSGTETGFTIEEGQNQILVGFSPIDGVTATVAVHGSVDPSVVDIALNDLANEVHYRRDNHDQHKTTDDARDSQPAHVKSLIETTMALCGRQRVKYYLRHALQVSNEDVDIAPNEEDIDTGDALLTDGGLERVTVRIHSMCIDDLEELVERGEYANVSDAIRTAVERLPGVDADAMRGNDGQRYEKRDASSGMASVSPATFGPVTDGGVSTTWSQLNASQRDIAEAVSLLSRDGETVTTDELVDELRHRRRDDVSQAVVYRNVSDLVKMGVIEKNKADDGRTNLYQLSEPGREMLKERVHRLADAHGMSVTATDGGSK